MVAFCAATHGRWGEAVSLYPELSESHSLSAPLYKLRGAAAVGLRRPLHAAGGPAWCVGAQQPPPRPCGAAQGLLRAVRFFRRHSSRHARDAGARGSQPLSPRRWRGAPLLIYRARRWRGGTPSIAATLARRASPHLPRDAGAAATPLSPRRWRGAPLFHLPRATLARRPPSTARNAGAAAPSLAATLARCASLNLGARHWRSYSTSLHTGPATLCGPLSSSPIGGANAAAASPFFPFSPLFFTYGWSPAAPVDPGLVVIGNSVSHLCVIR